MDLEKNVHIPELYDLNHRNDNEFSKTTNIHINSFIKYLGSNKKLSIQEISDEPKFKL